MHLRFLRHVCERIEQVHCTLNKVAFDIEDFDHLHYIQQNNYNVHKALQHILLHDSIHASI